MSKKVSKTDKTLEELLEEALVPEEEQPYKVPGNWVWTRIGEVSAVNPPKFTPAEVEDTSLASFIPMGAVSEITGAIENPEIRDYKSVKRGYTSFIKNDILFAKITPCMENGKSAIATNLLNGFGFGSTEFHVLRTKEALNNKLLYHLVRSEIFRKQAKQVMTGAVGQQRVPKEFLELYPFPLPPLPEQKRIVERIDFLLNKINKAKELIEEARETFANRREAILAKTFRGELTKKWREEHPNAEPAEKLLEWIKEEKEKLEANGKRRKKKEELSPIDPPYELPKGWCWVKLDEIVVLNPPKIDTMSIPDEQLCTFVPMSAVSSVNGIIESAEQKPVGQVRKGYTNFCEGDILFAKITPCMENGKSAIASNLLNGIGFGSTEFYVLRPIGKDINNKLIYYLLRSERFRKQAREVMTGAVGQQRVPKEFIENYLFPLPPVEEQREMSRVIEKLTEVESDIDRCINLSYSIEDIRNSILSKAFRGELGTNNMEEESALELLKEVLKEKAKEN